jgi:hypothetical protein
MKIEITSNSKAVQAFFNDVVKRQMPFATMLAINDTARAAREELINEMRMKFDRPTPWTLRSIDVQWAKDKQNPSAWVGLKESYKDYSAAKIEDPHQRALRAEFTGGNRSWKKMEAAFASQSVGILKKGWAMIPGEGAPLDRYGNVPVGFIKQLMSYFAANWDVGSKQNSTAKSRKGLEKRVMKKYAGGGADRLKFFVHFPGSGPQLLPGIYQRIRYGKSWELEPIFIFTPKRPVYKRRIYVERVADELKRTHYPKFLSERLAKAIATDRQLNRTLSR